VPGNRAEVLQPCLAQMPTNIRVVLLAVENAIHVFDDWVCTKLLAVLFGQPGTD
jgi:hypothetical protein